ncbi:MAG: Hsp70 family protein [Erysipelothrix sp.]
MRIGIDLGTTNSLVAMRRDGKTLIIPNQFGKKTTPSVVSMCKDQIYVGEMAHQVEIENPENTFRIFKRSMGASRTFGDQQVSAIDLSSLVIKQLIDDAETFSGEMVDEVIVSVPAYFTDAQRQATRQSALMCGVKCERIINEPSAAALAYYTETKKEGIVLVFDFGGGTLDVTVVDIFDNIVDIVSIAGDNNLGGYDIDMVIYNLIVKKFPELQYISLEQRKILDKKIEDMKIALSEKEAVTSTIIINNIEHVITLSQEELIKLSKNVLLTIRDVVSRALTDAGINARDIEDVVCVGGSCKSIIIQEYLRELMNQKIDIEVNPDEAIVTGLGMMLAIMDREEIYKDIILTDVCPFSLGIQIVGNVFSPIIKKNTTLPTSRTSYYVTVWDNQDVIELNVYQGESLIADLNKLLLNTAVKVIEKPRGMAGAYVTFMYDINGILKVEVKGDDIIESYQSEILTNSLISEEEIEKTKKIMNDFSNQKKVDREEFLIARMGRLSQELNYEKNKELKALFMEFNHSDTNMPKGERILYINEINRKLDELQKEIYDPFEFNPVDTNRKYN